MPEPEKLQDRGALSAAGGGLIRGGGHQASDRAGSGGLPACDEGGYVLAGEDCATNVPGLFAAGDVRKKPIRQIVTAVADGAMAAYHAEAYLLSENF